MSKLPDNFSSLSALEKRAAVERASGLTWTQFSSMPTDVRLATLNALKGNTYLSGVNEMAGAAKSDAFWSGVRGYVSGLSTAGTVLLVGGIALAAWIALPTLAAAPAKIRKAFA